MVFPIGAGAPGVRHAERGRHGNRDFPRDDEAFDHDGARGVGRETAVVLDRTGVREPHAPVPPPGVPEHTRRGGGTRQPEEARPAALGTGLQAEGADAQAVEKFLAARPPGEIDGPHVKVEAPKTAGGFQVVLLGDGKDAEAEPFVPQQPANVDHGVPFVDIGKVAVVVDVVAVHQEGAEGGVVAPATGLTGTAVGRAGGIFPKAFDPFGHGHVGAAQRHLAGGADGDRGQDGQTVVVVGDGRTVDGRAQDRRPNRRRGEGSQTNVKKRFAFHVFFCIVAPWNR